ncbi:hypothetical protein PAXRUDRAFT_28532 [Paxillus rubicundulus Ve08.2h10]|uniref:Uncharacterized protein n=1 Tax=Paxillus rubicundulus Ve08.2h10 TaxID=930991 RepID=A0A0D0CTQ7_9AGAM|nr:hypothetical protein PAXRUDRAFT_28532 [Paxillus rubicundulus Ve08.2h10]
MQEARVSAMIQKQVCLSISPNPELPVHPHPDSEAHGPDFEANFTTNNNGHPSTSTNEAQPEHSPPPPDMETHFFGPADKLYRNYHSKLTGQPCNAAGAFLPDGSPPPPLHNRSDNDWTPYHNRLEFELANFLYMCNQMPEKQIDALLDIWAASLMKSGLDSLFADHKDLYKTINSTPLGNVKWECFSIKHTGIQPEPTENSLPWMNNIYDVWFHTPLNVI